MSDEQFSIYEAARSQERKQEKSSKKKKGKVDENGVFQEPTSTYRIFSRLFCNFVMPKTIGRPLPKEEFDVKDESGVVEAEAEAEAEGKEKTRAATATAIENPRHEEAVLNHLYEEVVKRTSKIQKEAEEDREDEMEGDEIIDKFADSTYERRLKNAMDRLEHHASEYLKF